MVYKVAYMSTAEMSQVERAFTTNFYLCLQHHYQPQQSQ